MESMEKKLKGKIALVTGASRGIGAAIAKRLAQDGADIAISYVSSKQKADELVKELKALGIRSEAFQADQAKTDEVEKMVKEVVKHFGRIDILVNNAGVFSKGALGDSTTDVKALMRQQAINLDGVVAATRTAVSSMPEGGRIILIGSILGERVPSAGLADYSATKAALTAYAKGWARDLGPKNITVNNIQPGPINTDMNPDNTASADHARQGNALGRYGKPEEVAAAVAFIAGPEASYITGTTLSVDGGQNA